MNKFSSDLYKCLFCRKIFTEPVLLPCENTACKNCANQEKECCFCKEIHTVPFKGFPKIKILESIIIEKENDSASLNSRTLKCSVRSLIRRVLDLENAIKNPADEAKEYCVELKRQVQLSAEEKIFQINLIQEAFMHKIEKFQKEFNEIEKLEKNDFIRDEIDSFCKDWSQRLESNDFLIIEAIKEKAKCFEIEINMAFIKLRNIVFKEKLIEFEPNEKDLKSNDIGWLDYKTIMLPKFVDLKSYDMKVLMISDPYFPIRMTMLENGNHVVVYVDKASRVLIGLFDRNFSLLKEASFQTPSGYYQYLKLYSYKNILIVQSHNGNSYNIKVLDQDLNMQAFLIKNALSPITFNNDNIISLEASNLFFYNYGLTLKMQIVLNNIQSESYLSPTITQIECLKNKLFLKDSSKIRVLDLENMNLSLLPNQIIERRFFIDSKHNYVITVDDDLKRIHYYMLNGYQCYQDEPEDYPADLEACFSQRNGFSFYDAKTGVIYKSEK